MDPLSRPRGLTLAESIIAIFILIAGFCVMSRLFHSGLQYQASIDSQQLAVMIAERKMEEIRAWSRSVHAPRGTTPFTTWSGCPGSPGPTPDPDFPEYSVTVSTLNRELYSPCSLFELEYTDPARRRVMRSSLRSVEVSVAWKGRVFTLTSLVGAPPGAAAATNPVEVQPAAGTSLDPGVSGNFSASLKDSLGNPMPDIFFLWYVAGTGDGTVIPERTGATARLVNQIYDATPPPAGPQATGVGAGPCEMVARARYLGRNLIGVSGQVLLNP